MGFKILPQKQQTKHKTKNNNTLFWNYQDNTLIDSVTFQAI